MSPATDQPAALAAALRERGETFLRLRDEVVENPDPELVHDLRVASRRLRAMLELARALTHGLGLGAARRRVRAVTRELGRLRNLDEALLFFGSRPGVPAVPLLEQLRQRRRDEWCAMETLLEALPVRRLARRFDQRAGRLEAALRDDPIELAARLADIADRLVVPIRDLLPLARDAERVAERHALRIAVKKWRYFLEICRPLPACPPHPGLDLLKEYQELLGRLNDQEAFAALVRDLAPDPELARVTVAERRQLLAELAALLAARPLFPSPA